MFVAITVAYTLDPQTKLNGDANRTLVGIVHYIALMIWLDAPLQYNSSWAKLIWSDNLIRIVYEIIGDPFA